MLETYPSPTLTFNVAWLGALKSARLRSRRRRIRQLRAATRPSAINKSTSSGPYRLVKLVLLKLLECELRLHKTTIRKSLAAAAQIHSKRNGMNGHDH